MSFFPRVCVVSRIAGLREAIEASAAPSLASITYVDDLEAAGSALAECTVLVGEPGVCKPLIARCPKLEWLQSTFAGCNPLLEQPRRDFVTTRLAGCFGPDMAEYAALHILRLERQHEEQQAAARRCEWNDARDGEGRVHSSSDYRRLSSLTLGVLGLGDIGSGIARACSLGLRMNVIGCRRDSSPRASDAEAGVSKVFALSELAAFLAASDYIVSVLPSTPDTRGLLDGQVLAACAARSARGVALINVGRGDLLSETSILRAVDSGWLSHYVGDVFQVEPLPASSSLWRHPRVTVTPHNSAVTAPQDVATAFGDNLSRFVGGAPSGPDERFGPGLSGDAAMDPVGARARGVEALRNVFNWEAGY